MTSQLLAVSTLLILGVTLAASAESNFDQLAMLRAFSISCKDCKTLQYGDTTLVEVECQAGTVCGPSGNAYQCIAEDSPDAAKCSCGDKENTYIPEPYAPGKYIACLPGGDQSVLECEAGQIFTGDTAVPCAKGPECTTTAGAVKGFNALLPDCTKYYVCVDVVAAAPDPAPSVRVDVVPVPTYDCPAGQVFDVLKPGCVDPCTLAPEPFACKPEDSGPFADPKDCHIFHLCFNGIQIGDPISCPDDQYYSVADDKCIDSTEADGSCPAAVLTAKEINPCYEHYQSECAA